MVRGGSESDTVCLTGKKKLRGFGVDESTTIELGECFDLGP
jgi:hypothetical protein